MKFGLRNSDIDEIGRIMKRFPEVDMALIFGSRAVGNYRHGSDVDIALKGSDVDFEITSKIAGILNEDTLMPYRFDVLDYNGLKNDDLRNHIERIGVILYQSGSVVGVD